MRTFSRGVMEFARSGKVALDIADLRWQDIGRQPGWIGPKSAGMGPRLGRKARS